MASQSRSTVPILAVACILALSFISCSNDRTAPPDGLKKPVEVKVVTAQPAAISRTVEATGSVVPYRIVQMASPAEGPVVSLRVREGDDVRQGDTLLVIGRRAGTEAQIVSLQENVQKEKANLDRVERLAEIDGSSKEQLDQAIAANEVAKAQLVKAQEAARDYVVVAPWNGITSRVFVEVGDYNYVNPRKPLLELYDPASLIVLMNVPEAKAALLKRNAPVSVRLDAYPDTVLSGTISRIYPYLDERMRTRAVEVTLAGGLDLLPGMFARAKLQVGADETALVIPSQAVVLTSEATTVSFVVVDGKAQRRVIRTGIEEAGRVQIIDGIRPGDSVIVAGGGGLRDGQPVRIIEARGPVADQQAAEKQTRGDAVSTSPGGAR